jgi:hypothetical protein
MILRVSAIAALMIVAASSGQASAQATDTSPTCSDELDIAVHGQHVIGDYVTGVTHEALSWPPDGSEVGSTVSSNGGVAVPGGPGPGFHFIYGYAPGASFCTNANSWGVPRGRN